MKTITEQILDKKSEIDDIKNDILSEEIMLKHLKKEQAILIRDYILLLRQRKEKTNAETSI